MNATFTDLRTYDDAQLRDEAFSPNGVRCAYCPVCRCTKSGYADEPNRHTEACDRFDCLCHADEEPHAGGLRCSRCNASIPVLTAAEAADLCERYATRHADEYCTDCLDHLTADGGYWMRLEQREADAMTAGDERFESERG